MNASNIEAQSLTSEQKYVSYLLRHPNESLELPSKYILNSSLQQIVKSIQTLYGEYGLDKFDIDTVIIECSQKGFDFDREKLKVIYDSFVEFKDISYIKKRLKASYLKYNIKSNLLEELLVKSTSVGRNPDKEIEDIELLSKEILDNINEISGEVILLDSETLVEDHRNLLEKRRKGLNKKSLGYKALNQLLTRPGDPCEITAIVGMKGSGKSAYCKNIENLELNKGTCILSINPEMPTSSNMDRLICIRGNFETSDLLVSRDIEKYNERIQSVLDDILELENYLYIEESDINLDKVDSLIYKAKQRFKKRGVLPDDEYILVTFDLLDMLSDFDDADPIKIKKAMNKLHRILKKHKCHGLIVLQANENKIRGGKMFKKPKDLDFYKIGLEDIEGGSAFGARARVVLTFNRPRLMKIRFFPEDERLWLLEEDFVNIHCVKQNDGDLFLLKHIFNRNFRILPYIITEDG